jgi:hypothetical protein
MEGIVGTKKIMREISLGLNDSEDYYKTLASCYLSLPGSR